MNDVEAWFAGRLPAEWFDGEPVVTVDREEIVVVGAVPAGRVEAFREETRGARMTIADEAEELFGRKVAWGVQVGGERHLFTHLAVPVMTRLRQPERQVLDTLVEAGVARSRSEALAWSVRLVAQHEADWIQQLKDSLGAVRAARAAGPGV